MDGVALEGLIERHGTPFFLVSERRVLANFRALSSGLATAGVDIRLRYCAKANHEAGVLKILARAECEVLASHLAEVELALACGFPADRIAYQRPTSTVAEIEVVLACGVTHLHVFRPADVELLAELAERRGVTLRLSLRLREERRLALSPLAGLNARLGLSSREAIQIARDCASRPRLRVVALNVYVGTQQLRANGFDRALRRACDLARVLALEGTAEISEINLGGGVPSPSLRRLSPRRLWARFRDRPLGLAGNSPRELEEFASLLAKRYLTAARKAGLTRPPALGAEPGRSIIGNAAVLVSRVAAADPAEHRWLFLDASRNFLGESPLLFSRSILPVRESSVARRLVNLSGSTLNTTDVLDLWRRLPVLTAGEALVFCDAGAYSISRANRYAGMSPAVLLVDLEGAVRTIRRPEGVAELMAPMVVVNSG